MFLLEISSSFEKSFKVFKFRLYQHFVLIFKSQTHFLTLEQHLTLKFVLTSMF